MHHIHILFIFLFSVYHAAYHFISCCRYSSIISHIRYHSSFLKGNKLHINSHSSYPIQFHHVASSSTLYKYVSRSISLPKQWYKNHILMPSAHKTLITHKYSVAHYSLSSIYIYNLIYIYIIIRIICRTQIISQSS